MGVYVIWKFAKNKEAAKKYLVDQQLAYREHFVRSQFYNFPPWTGRSRAASRRSASSPRRTRTSRGQVHGPDDDRREVHDEPRPPGQHDAGDGRDLQHVPDPADVRRGRPGQVDARPKRSPPSRARRRASTASGGTRGSSRRAFASVFREGPGDGRPAPPPAGAPRGRVVSRPGFLSSSSWHDEPHTGLPRRRRSRGGCRPDNGSSPIAVVTAHLPRRSACTRPTARETPPARPPSGRARSRRQARGRGRGRRGLRTDALAARGIRSATFLVFRTASASPRLRTNQPSEVT